MADALQTQEAGGGEGLNQSPAQDVAKPASPSEPQAELVQNAVAAKVTEKNEAKKGPEATAIKSEESKTEETKPGEPVAPSAPVDLAAQPAPVASEPVAVAVPVQDASVAAAPEAKKPDEVTDPVPVTTAAPASTDQNANNVENSTLAEASSNWQQRELELLKKIEELEKVKTEKCEDILKLELKVREDEIDLLKARVRNLETELHAALSKPSGKNHEMIENIKQQHEELISKARGMIFDKTKMVKNQELQIEALTTQVQSLKDINLITKDLLEIRNSEVKAMEDRLQAMEARFKVEKERYCLVLERAQTSTNINDDLKKEYVTQLAIFKELREKYEQKVQALVAENEKLKAAISSGAGSSTQ